MIRSRVNQRLDVFTKEQTSVLLLQKYIQCMLFIPVTLLIATSCRILRSQHKSSIAGRLFSVFSGCGRMTGHTKCRHPYAYPGTDVKRFKVPDEKVPWTAIFPEYEPTEYTAEKVLDRPIWADPDLSPQPLHPSMNFNGVDAHYNVDRKSNSGVYEVIDNRPRNPVGRTGMSGRGLLGRWGPNHAADPIVTRWKMDEKGNKIMNDGKPLLEFVSIQRRDSGEWAIPGGMVNPGDNVPNTLKAEFGEEALNSIEATNEEKKMISAEVDKLFTKGLVIYSGYVDDPRNTDNAWMETVAVNFHDEDGNAFNKIKLQAGDDAKAVRWTVADRKLNLYANHAKFIADTCKLHDAHF